MWLHSWPCKPDKNHWVNRVNRRAKHCKYRMTPYLLIIYIWPQPHTKHQNITNSKNLSWLTWRLLFFIASSIASKSFSAGFEHHRAKRVTTCHNVSQHRPGMLSLLSLFSLLRLLLLSLCSIFTCVRFRCLELWGSLGENSNSSWWWLKYFL